MCRWMGSQFHDRIDSYEVAFSIELLKQGRTFSGFRRYENSGRWDLNIGRFAINRRYRWDRKNYIRPKMESIMGPRIDHSGVGVLRGQRHKVKIDSINPPPPPGTMAKSNIKFVAHNVLHTIRRRFTCRSRYYISLLRFLQRKKNITRSLYFLLLSFSVSN